MNPIHFPRRSVRHPLIAILMGMAAIPALAQWQWTDNSGKKVFSDSPPPQEIPDRNIIKRPAGVPFVSAPTAAPGSASAAPATNAAVAPKPAVSAPKVPTKDSELEKRKAQAESEEASRKKAEEQKQAAARSENCERAKRNLASLQSGARIAQVNAQGEREFLSDEGKQAEIQRTQGIINADCR